MINEFRYINPEQWINLKRELRDILDSDLIPCPYCGELRIHLRKIPDRYIFYLRNWLYSKPIKHLDEAVSDYSCDYCIALAAQRKREYEVLLRTPHCGVFYHMHSSGIVYFADCGDSRIKIGRSGKSGSINQRLKAIIREYNVISVNLIKAISTDCAVGLERWFHEEYADCRIRGEMFKISSYQIEYIIGLPDFIKAVDQRMPSINYHLHPNNDDGDSSDTSDPEIV